MSINSLIDNPIILSELSGALGSVFSVTNTDENLTISPSTGAVIINMAPEISVSRITSTVTTQFNLNCISTGAYGAISMNNTSSGGKSWSIYNNGGGATFPSTLNIYNESTATSVLTFNGVTGNVGINNPSPTSKLSVVGLQNYADNAAALLAGLHAGDFYYTNTGGDGLLKVVI